MTVLTSTGAVNLTSATNWSPAQIPVDGDDLIIGAHTLTLDADRRLDSITINSSGTRFAISGTTRSVEATNGFILNASNGGGALISTTLTTGMTVTLTGQWRVNGNFGFGSALAVSTGGNLILRTVGSSQSAVLVNWLSPGTNAGYIITGSWSGGTLTTIGRFDGINFAGSTSFVSMSGGTWNHQSSGLNSFGASGHRLAVMTGTATVNWTGSVDSQSNIANSGLFLLSSSSTSHTIGQTGDTFCLRNAVAVANQLTSIVYGTAGTVELVGVFSGRLDGLAIVGIGSTINWRNQSVVIPATDHCGIYMVAGTLNLSGLVVSNPTKFLLLDVGSATTTASAGTSITNTSTSATACAFGTTALDGRIVTLASDPPTLPAVQNVASGTVYGYSGSPLTGTGIINDPATIAAAMITSFSSLPEVMVRTTIATLSSQTEFTLTAGSSDNDVYNGLMAIITDQASSIQKAAISIGDYVGSTRTVTLSSAPGFTIATGDLVTIIAGASGGSSNSDIAAIKAKTDNLPSDPADQSLIIAATDAILAAVNGLPVNVRNEILDRVLAGNHDTSGTVGRLLQFLASVILAQNANQRTVQVTGSNHIAADAHEIQTAVLAKFASVNTGETTTAVGSVARLSQGTSGGGGGDATLAKQEEILDAIDAYITGVQAAAADEPGTIVGFPASLKVGDSYTEATNNSINISILDESDNPVTSWGDFSTSTTGFTPELYITLAGNAGRIKAVVTHDATPESHYVVEFPVEVWKRASAGTGTMQFVLRWYDTNGKVVAQRTIVAAQAVSLTGEI